MNLFSMAWRNVWRNSRRSTVTIGAMTFALWVLVIYSGLIEGYFVGMEEDVLELEVGDVQVHAPGFLDSPSLYDVVKGDGAVIAAIEAKGLRASSRLLAGGLGASGDQSAGVRIVGIDPEQDRTVLRLHTYVAAGSWLDGADPQGAVIGRRLAKALSAEPGDELLLLSQAADGSVANALFTVRGVLTTVSDGTDRAGVFVQQTAFREMFGLPEGAHQIIVRRPAGSDLEAQVALVREAAPGLDVQTWRQLLPTVATMLDSARGMIAFIYFIFYLAVAILVLNAVLMAVFERIKEFGVMKAIGVSPLSVFGMILLETGIQVGIAVAVGLTLAAPVMWYLTEVGIDVGVLGGTSVMGMSMRQMWHGIYGPGSMLAPVLMLAAMSLAAALYPAFKAASIRPLDAMRYR
jgi:putative ABC transport system permease protein